MLHRQEDRAKGTFASARRASRVLFSCAFFTKAASSSFASVTFLILKETFMNNGTRYAEHIQSTNEAYHTEMSHFQISDHLRPRNTGKKPNWIRRRDKILAKL